MNWSSLLMRYGYTEDRVGAGADPFMLVQPTDPQYPRATVSMTVGTSGEYGSVKCTAQVTIQCPQNEAAINMAAELCFRKAVELVNDGASYIGAPPLQEVQ